MNARLHKRHFRPDTGQSVYRVLVTVSLLALILASAWLAAHEMAAPSASVPADRYLGVVQLAPDEQGRCEQFELDNKAGLLRPKGSGRCLDVTSSSPARGPVGPLQSIRDHFRSR